MKPSPLRIALALAGVLSATNLAAQELIEVTIKAGDTAIHTLAPNSFVIIEKTNNAVLCQSGCVLQLDSSGKAHVQLAKSTDVIVATGRGAGQVVQIYSGGSAKTYQVQSNVQFQGTEVRNSSLGTATLLGTHLSPPKDGLATHTFGAGPLKGVTVSCTGECDVSQEGGKLKVTSNEPQGVEVRSPSRAVNVTVVLDEKVNGVTSTTARTATIAQGSRAVFVSTGISTHTFEDGPLKGVTVTCSVDCAVSEKDGKLKVSSAEPQRVIVKSPSRDVDVTLAYNQLNQGVTTTATKDAKVEGGGSATFLGGTRVNTEFKATLLRGTATKLQFDGANYSQITTSVLTQAGSEVSTSSNDPTGTVLAFTGGSIIGMSDMTLFCHERCAVEVDPATGNYLVTIAFNPPPTVPAAEARPKEGYTDRKISFRYYNYVTQTMTTAYSTPQSLPPNRSIAIGLHGDGSRVVVAERQVNGEALQVAESTTSGSQGASSASGTTTGASGTGSTTTSTTSTPAASNNDLGSSGTSTALTGTAATGIGVIPSPPNAWPAVALVHSSMSPTVGMVDSHTVKSNGALATFSGDFASNVSGAAGTDFIACQPGNCTEPYTVRWGTWRSGTVTHPGPSVSNVTNTDRLHFILGNATAPSVIDARTGSVTFAHIGGTTPIGADGTLYTATVGSIAVTFGGSPSATLSQYTVAPPSGTTYSFTNVALALSTSTTSSGSVKALATSGLATGTNNGRLEVNGLFLGATGSHIGAAMQVTDSINSSVKINSVQAFKQ